MNAASVARLLRPLWSRRALAVALVGALLLCYGDTSEAHHSSAGPAAQEHAAAESLSSCEAKDGAMHDPVGDGVLSALSLLITILAIATLTRLVLVWRLAPVPVHSRPPPPLPVVRWPERGRRGARLQVFRI